MTLYVEKNGNLTLNEAEITLDALGARLKSVREANPDVRIYVKGDSDVPYGSMMQIMAEVTAAGVTQVAFVTDPSKKKPK